MIRKLYPYGKRKAFNVTYDDGVAQDVRFVHLLNVYGLKGTFNLNSALMESGFTWIHDSGCPVRRLQMQEVGTLYEGHEIASHTLTHPYMHNLTKEQILQELFADKAKLEALFGREVKGFAVPFDYYSELIEMCVKECGFAYARISEESRSFCPQNDYYNWRATVFHGCRELESITERFLQTDEELALFQIVGHSYDLDVENKWDTMEAIFRVISQQKDVLPMTTIDMVCYLQAMDQAEITKEYIQNNSHMPLWFEACGIPREVKPREKLVFSMEKVSRMG